MFALKLTSDSPRENPRVLASEASPPSAKPGMRRSPGVCEKAPKVPLSAPLIWGLKALGLGADAGLAAAVEATFGWAATAALVCAALSLAAWASPSALSSRCSSARILLS